MSPTMTEGGIASWKVKEGEKFSAGDVILEIVRVFLGVFLGCPALSFFSLVQRKETQFHA